MNDRITIDELVLLETALIFDLAGERHDKVCARGSDCLNREGHVRRAYLPREREARVEHLKSLVRAAAAVR